MPDWRVQLQVFPIRIKGYKEIETWITNSLRTPRIWGYCDHQWWLVRCAARRSRTSGLVAARGRRAGSERKIRAYQHRVWERVIAAGQQPWRDCSLGQPNLRLSLDFCYFNPFKMIFLILTHHHFKAFGLPNKTGVRACSRCSELKYLFNSLALNLWITSSNVFSTLLLSSGCENNSG
jgi:hypothetical protein